MGDRAGGVAEAEGAARGCGHRIGQDLGQARGLTGRDRVGSGEAAHSTRAASLGAPSPAGLRWHGKDVANPSCEMKSLHDGHGMTVFDSFDRADFRAAAWRLAPHGPDEYDEYILSTLSTRGVAYSWRPAQHGSAQRWSR